VSILTPSFDQARWLPDNLASVAAQTYPHIEHIVMDGGSTDGSVEILRGAGPSVRWASEPDRGQSHAVNKAFAASTGEIIGWLNSDDAFFSATAVEQAVAVFRSRPHVGIVYGHGVMIGPDARILLAIWVPPYAYRLLRLHNFFILQPAAFVRRSAIRGELLDESYHYTMDRELWLRVTRTWQAMRLPQILAVDREHDLRKSYAMRDVGLAEEQRLAATYGVSYSTGAALVRKVIKVWIRLMGLGLIRSALRVPTTFPMPRDGWLALARRQTVAPRSRIRRGA
jgi:glycosyltransferase involved in cell wall biosynthesis